VSGGERGARAGAGARGRGRARARAGGGRAGGARLQLLLELRDDVVALLHLRRVLLPLVRQVLLQPLDGGGDLLLLRDHLEDHVVARLVLLDRRRQRREGVLAQLAQRLRQQVLKVRALRLDLREVLGDVRVALQVSAQLLRRLAQRARDLLDLLLVLLRLLLVRERLQRRALRDQLLVPRLEPALLLYDPRDLVAHDRRELVAVRHDVGRDRREERELLERLLDDRGYSRALDHGERHGSASCSSLRYCGATCGWASVMVHHRAQREPRPRKTATPI